MAGIGNRLIQSPQLRQELRINPRLYQAMELLYMPVLELQQHLKQELTENPFLELSEADVEGEVELSEEGAEEVSEDEMDWEDILLDGFDVGGRKSEFEAAPDRQILTPTPPEGLLEFLMEQLHHLDLTHREVMLGEEILGNLEESGALTCSLEEVLEGANRWLDDVREVATQRAQTLEDPQEREAELEEILVDFRPYAMDEAEAVLAVIQGFDPPGVGARDLRESLLIQLRRQEMEDSLAFRLVEEHFDDFVARRWREIARELGVPAKQVQDAADEVARLDPKPGLAHDSEPERYIIPDLVVDKIDGQYMVFLNDTYLPRLRLSSSYRQVAADRGSFTGENRDFINQKMNAATWMVQAIEQRRQTMLKVMHYIVDRQRDFFEKGVEHLRPLTLREVADHIEMHESTVSRVTNEKYVQTPRGVLSLKFFFSSGLSTDSGEDISARGVKSKIRHLVDGEDEKKPLTDQALVRLLEEDGVQIARRTVAKYRDQLGILPARMRKRL